MNKYISNRTNLYNKYCNKKKQLSFAMLENQIKQVIDSRNEFKFHLYYLCWCLIMSINEGCCLTFIFIYS